MSRAAGPIAVTLILSILAPALARAAEQGTPIDRTPEYWYAYVEKLPIGATVQVRTTDGKRQTAVLAVVDRDGITLEPKTRLPEPARRIRFAEIQQLELKENGSGILKSMAVGAAVGAGTFLGILIVTLVATGFD
jgi:hypothetical protein